MSGYGRMLSHFGRANDPANAPKSHRRITHSASPDVPEITPLWLIEDEMAHQRSPIIRALRLRARGSDASI